MKKILHISNYFPPHYGGIEQVAYDIVTGLKNDYEQKLVCFNHVKYTVVDEIKRIPIIRVGYLFKISSQAISFKYFFLLRKIIKEFNPDIIHFHLPNPLIVLYLLLINVKSTKLILHWHSDIIEQKILYIFFKPFEKLILNKANKIIVATPYHLEYSNILNKYRKKVDVFTYCIDFNKFNKFNEFKTEINKENIIFFLGRHVKYKGIEYLIRASKYINSNIKIIIAGIGPLTDNLKEISSNISNVEFVGKLTNDNVIEYLYKSKLFIFPSITKNEAFGVAMAEAMYCGLPVISFKIPGSGVNWVNRDNYTGISVENKNTIELANAINKVIEDEDLRKIFSNNAKCWSKLKFNKKTFLENIKRTYEN